MLSFTTSLLKFGDKGEKTSWTYIDIPVGISQTLNPDTRTAYRVKGQLDRYVLRAVALLPMGEGSFIMPINAEMRRAIRKEAGATVTVQLERDEGPLPLSPDLLDCLADAPEAQTYFNTLTKGHQLYFSNWIEEAKTTATKASRIAKAVQGLAMGLDYGAMIRYHKHQNRER